MGSNHGPIGILEDHIKESDKKLSTHAFVGGAMIVNQSNVTLTHSRLENNHANIGGAIFGTVRSTITVINSSFTENYACLVQNETCFDGALYFENGLNGGNGGAMKQISIINSEFNSNTAFYGGVLTTFNQCTISITSSRFFDNRGEYQLPACGGVLD